MATRWTAYSQALLQKNFPEFRRTVVFDSGKWDALYFVPYCSNSDTQYTILVDEDCFVFDRAQVLQLLDYMDQHQDVALFGSPDGGTFHRHLNPIACNTFFLIVRNSAISSIGGAGAWKDLKYGDVRTLADFRHVAALDQNRIDYELEDQYYPFFWYVLKAGWKIEYFVPAVDKDLLASKWAISPEAVPLLLHMWWLRDWSSRQVNAYLKVSNYSRYSQLESRWLSREFSRPGDALILYSQLLFIARRSAKVWWARMIAKVKRIAA